jgi:probable phosphoglycerate mutase
VLCGPLQRARRSAELAGLGEQASINPDLAEWNDGSYEGLTSAAIRVQHPGWLVFRDACPKGKAPPRWGSGLTA